MLLLLSLLSVSLLRFVQAALTTSETSTTVQITNDRLGLILSKSNGRITTVTLDGQSLLGNSQYGLYYDCYCIKSGFYTPGADNVTLITGKDSENKDYAGISVINVYKPTGQYFQKWWFMRDGGTDIHHFTRLAYYNETTPFLQGLGELRTLFRPASGVFTHLVSNEKLWGPLPGPEAIQKQVTVQDATWYMGNAPNDPYVQQVSDYFTKYTFSVPWRKHKAHGLYADGSTTGGIPYGVWLVMETKDTYFNGPIHSDLVVDGIAYDYIISNHRGNGVPNITHGFDRTFGPVFYHFNAGAPLETLREEAEAMADPNLNAKFYDDIAPHITGYVTTSQRGSFSAKIALPRGASNPIAVLALNGADFQDNNYDTKAYQYWGEVNADGTVAIPRIKAGTYRLTIYADGIFGDYIQDNIKINAGKKTSINVRWVAESAGRELWRIGIPDKSSGEFRHGDTPDPHPQQFPESSIYWGAYDFPQDFPNGVNYTIGKSSLDKDLNYIHWSVFGPTYNRADREIYKISNWTINFQLEKNLPFRRGTATFTVQLAGVKTASGNNDVRNGNWSDLPLTYYFNENPLTFVVPYHHSSSCGVRSSTQCYQVSHKFKFAANWLKPGWNQLILSVPFNATDIQTAQLPTSVYVQYDALRLEIDG